MVYNSLHRKAPQYLMDCCIPSLTWPVDSILSVPRHNLSTYGRWAFFVAGPAAWKTPSDDLCDLALSTVSDDCLKLICVQSTSTYK